MSKIARKVVTTWVTDPIVLGSGIGEAQFATVDLTDAFLALDFVPVVQKFDRGVVFCEDGDVESRFSHVSESDVLDAHSSFF